MRNRKMAMVAALLATACGKGSDTRDEPAGPSAATAPAAQTAAKRPMTAADPAPPDTAGAGPFVVGGGGKRVPAGFPTTFTGPDGPVTVAYTQISGADLGGKIGMVLSFDAKPGEQMDLRKPGEPLVARVTASLSPDGFTVAKPADLAGKSFSIGGDQPAGIGASRLDIQFNDKRVGTAKTAQIRFTSATAEAIEGTFTATVDVIGADGKTSLDITDGKLRAYPAQFVVTHPRQ